MEQVILVTDDDKDDVELLSAAINHMAGGFTIETVSDGSLALQRLYDSSRPLPCLLVADVRLPKVSGLELLQAVKSDHQLAKLPVVIFSASQDTKRSLALGAAMHLEKPGDYNGYKTAASSMIAFCH